MKTDTSVAMKLWRFTPAALVLLASAGCATPDTPRSARVVVNCEVAAEGRLADCRVVSETPEGAGFGEAALKVVAEGRAPPGGEVGKRVNMTIRFRLADDGATPEPSRP